MLAPLEHELGVREQRLRARGEVEALRLDDHPPAAHGLQELEAERATAGAGRVDALGLDPGDLLQLRLRLPRLRPVAEARDEALEPGDVLGLALGALRLHGEPRRLLLAPDVPLAGEVGRAAALELEHGGADRFEEPAVVRDEDDGGVDRRELLLEPLHRLHVEVVGRLVEQQQVGPAGERACERGAGELAAGEGLETAVEVGVGEAEPAQDRGGVVAPAVAAGVLEAGLRLAVAPERLRCVVAAGHRLLQPAQLALGLDEVRGAGERVLAEREAGEPRRPLVVQRDARALLPGELAARELGLADQRAQQRRLAGAVRAGEREPVPALDLERDAVEERLAGELLAERGRDQDGHSLRVGVERPMPREQWRRWVRSRRSAAGSSPPASSSPPDRRCLRRRPGARRPRGVGVARLPLRAVSRPLDDRAGRGRRRRGASAAGGRPDRSRRGARRDGRGVGADARLQRDGGDALDASLDEVGRQRSELQAVLDSAVEGIAMTDHRGHARLHERAHGRVLARARDDERRHDLGPARPSRPADA